MINNFKDYIIKSVIGKGGMATVYLAENQKFGVHVAIKVLNREHYHNSNIRSRFFAEARHLYKMSHPNIVKAIDLYDEGETAAYVMDFIEGETLKAYIEHRGALSDEEVKLFLRQMLDALDFLHENHLVHRDIKPSNFIVSKNGKVKLMDFGIVKNLDPTSPEYTITETAQQMGTPMYMSPEQVKSSKDVTTASDIYSIGVVLWQMVTGRRPYDAKTMNTFDIQTKIVSEPLEKTQTQWDGLIEKATQKNPDTRFNSCPHFKHEIDLISSITSNTEIKSDHEVTVIDQPGKAEKTIVQQTIPSDLLLEGSILDDDGELKYGFVDLTGRWVIQPEFDSLGTFDDQGFCLASQNGKYGFINKNGKWLIEPIFEYKNEYFFDEAGYCNVVYKEKYGFINREGGWIIPPTYDYLGTFDSVGYCEAKINEKFGFIDRKGNWLIQPIFDYLSGFDEKEYCISMISEKMGVIDRKGEWIIQPIFDDINSFGENGETGAKLNGKMGLIDRHGNWIIQPIYDWINPFDENDYAYSKINNKEGFIGRDGGWIIPPIYDEDWMSLFFDELDYCRVFLNNKYGYIDRKGNWVIQPIFDHLSWFDEENFCSAKLNNQYGFIDRKGNWIIQTTFEIEGGFNDMGLCIIKDDNKKGYIDRLGNIKVQPALLCEWTDYNLIKVSERNKYGYKNAQNHWAISPIFDYQMVGKYGTLTWNDDKNTWEDNAYYNILNSYFESLTQSKKIYIGKNIPERKLHNMKNQLSTEPFENKEAVVYYDDTLWGKGDDGFAIFYDQDEDETYVLISVYNGVKMFVCTENQGDSYISDKRFSDKQGLSIEVRRESDEYCHKFEIGFNNPCGKALFEYLNHSY